MDPFEEYINKSDEVISITNKSCNATEFINKINKSSKINLYEDFDVIAVQLTMFNLQISLFEVMEELQNTGRTNVLIDNIDNIGMSKALEFAIKYKNDEISEYIYSNFNELIENFDFIDVNLIKEVLLESRNRPEMKNGIHTVVRNLPPRLREELLDEIDSNRLMEIEEYLEDFLYVEDGKTVYGIENVLSKLESIDDLDKIKLLQTAKDNLVNLVNSFNESSDFELQTFLETIKNIEDKLPDDSKEAQQLIDETNECISRQFENILKKYEYSIDLIITLRKFNIDNEKFVQLQDDIVQNLSQADLVIYIESAKGNEGFSRNWDAKELTSQIFKHNDKVSNDQISQKMISKLIEELCEHENKDIEDIEYGGSGFFNFNVKIGDYILKLGEERESEDIPNDRRILKPLVRQQTNAERNENIPNLFIEIQNVVDTKWTEGLTKEEIDEELYKIYSELRNRGKVWTDIKAENLGRLIKPNKENFDIEVLNENGEIETRELRTNNYAIGFNGEEPEEILEPGELVIIDTEYVFREGAEYKNPRGSRFTEFERRYEKEKQQLNNKIATGDIKNIIKGDGYTLEDVRGIKSKVRNFINRIMRKGDREK